MGLGIPPLNIKILLESNPVKSRILVGRSALNPKTAQRVSLPRLSSPRTSWGSVSGMPPSHSEKSRPSDKHGFRDVRKSVAYSDKTSPLEQIWQRFQKRRRLCGEVSPPRKEMPPAPKKFVHRADEGASPEKKSEVQK